MLLAVRTVARSLLDRLPYPSARVLAVVGAATVATQAGIGVTGSVVRVTDSGLACPTWPQCQPGAMAPQPHPDYPMLNQWIEFGNRLLTGIVVLVAVAALITALRIRRAHPERDRPVRLAWVILGGVAVQGGIGALTVKADLVWWMVATHFVASTILVWLAVLLAHAFNEGDRPARSRLGERGRTLLVTLGVLIGAIVVSGAVVTGAGPHAGDPDTERLDVPLDVVTTVHAAAVAVFLLVLVVLGLRFARGAEARFTRRYALLCGVVLAQGSLGVVQYRLGVPDPLVSLHVLGSFTVLIATAALWCAGRDRGRAPREVPEPGEEPGRADPVPR
ncbi:cytochrome c oxidase assembly protein subunit 15 [Haloechinothrix alba]|uniref:Cytochrome c oxidase assembly protein subunit 15 n=1 Tax=Haloechinothrix alba TaxID=664784 RepID=A0A238WXM8_9PSEU|nr:COX15/CtaA family protein [Haloechinothrix alba]SNR50964.1 cytochrome c oxidase assembly protein subunit 15 [Haloechinothrix alba]